MKKTKPEKWERHFYRRVFHIEVLSEDPIPEDPELADIAYNITEGTCSGVLTSDEQTILNGPAMAERLAAQGSDPAFFGLTEDGDSLED